MRGAVMRRFTIVVGHVRAEVRPRGSLDVTRANSAVAARTLGHWAAFVSDA
jgi:hypothetical protein